MCITKKATKNQDKPLKKSSEESKNKKKVTPNQKKKFRVPMFARKKSKEEEPKIDKKTEEENKEKSIKEEKVEVKNEQEDVNKNEEKVEIQKEPPRRPAINRPNIANPTSGLSGTQKKKTNKYKYGQIDREELSINNDKTEYLENAQLTKLMSHADVKALMNGQLVQGENGDDPNCQDTVEEVDDEMQDIAFSPLLAIIPPEDDKALGGVERG
ncbi:unnamed protein product [Caenorhabditis brenneri]